jgi:predicted Zn-dependent protease
MVNVAVINIKSLIKILLILFVVIFFIYFVQGLSINLDKLAFSPFILNQTIPGIATTNDSDFSSIETSYIESKSPLQFLLNSQLPVMSSIKIANNTIKVKNMETGEEKSTDFNAESIKILIKGE